MKILCATKRNNYHGFTLREGQYYGRDDKGYFVATRTLLKGDCSRSMRMFRLDVNRGWLPSWEASTTTQTVLRATFAANPRAHFVYELGCDESKQNMQAEVKNAKSYALWF